VSVLKEQTDRQTDGRTPDRYIMLSVRGGQRNNKVTYIQADYYHRSINSYTADSYTAHI